MKENTIRNWQVISRVEIVDSKSEGSVREVLLISC